MQQLAVSVLIPVYYGDNADYLREALNSVVHQSRPPEQIVLVQDGPLTDALYHVIDSFELPQLKVVVRKENGGLTAALNSGVAACDFPWIARMDADDICVPTRLEKQLDYLKRHPEVVLLGSWIDEFDEQMKIRFGSRVLPEQHHEIVNFAKWRCPFNHMSVVYKKSAVEALGGYEDFGAVGDDYVLWVRFLMGGYKTANFPQVLVNARGGKAFFNARRRGMSYLKNELKEVKLFYQMGFFAWYHFLIHVIVKSIIRLSPQWLVKWIYRMLRK